MENLDKQMPVYSIATTYWAEPMLARSESHATSQWAMHRADERPRGHMRQPPARRRTVLLSEHNKFDGGGLEQAGRARTARRHLPGRTLVSWCALYAYAGRGGRSRP